MDPIDISRNEVANLMERILYEVKKVVVGQDHFLERVLVAILAQGHGVPVFSGVDAVLAQPDTQLRLFGKPRVEGHRRVGVTAALGATIDQARERARDAAAQLSIELR